MNVTTVKLADLTEDPENPRTHDRRNLDAIRRSLEEFGQVEPLVVRKGSGVVVGGNGRLAVMREMGWEEVKVVEVELDDARARALGIALNRTAQLAEWDDEVLARALQSLQADDLTIGWTADEAESLVALVRGDFAMQSAGGLVDDVADARPGCERDSCWLYVEYYGEPERFKRITEQLGDRLQGEHDLDADWFERVALQESNDGSTATT